MPNTIGSPHFEIASVLVRVDHIASFVVNANQGVPIRLAKLARFFQNSARMKTTALPLRNSMNRSPVRAFLLIPFVLACFALSPRAQAVCQEGCLTNNNTVLGDNALFFNTTGSQNTANGALALYHNRTGGYNTATGYQALYSNRTGGYNTANGASALIHNTTGSFNTATGFDSLRSNTTGIDNTAMGMNALRSNTVGINNTACGMDALLFNTTGNGNMAAGEGALVFNTTGNDNTANGALALTSNTTGSFNTATGWEALVFNTTGTNNLADGFAALANNTTGNNNIALGFQAGVNLTTGNTNIDIGNPGVASESNTIRIGIAGLQTATFLAGVSGVTVTGTPVVVNSSGQLGVAPSSRRFKQNILSMGDKSDILFALRPVTFDYKPEVDPKGVSQFGLVAEEVAKVNPDLVARDDEGKPYSVRYEAVNAMLLNEFLKQHRRVEEQEATITQLNSTVAEQQKDFRASIAQQDRKIQEQEATITQLQKGMKTVVERLEEQASQIQKVSAELEASRRAQQTVVSNQ